MKAYILSDGDFARLLAEIDRNPTHGKDGGSSTVLNEEEKEAFNRAHRFYNYVVRKWVDRVKE